jgi:general secretion pathway protein A
MRSISAQTRWHLACINIAALVMYGEFFALKKLPFNLTPDPAFLFLPPKHREAFAGLTYAIQERKGFAVLTGDAGTGKTTLISSVLNRLPAEQVESSFILNPTLTVSEFLEGVLLDFDIPDVPPGKAQRLWKLQEFLAQMHNEGKLVVLVIDEAHKLSTEVLEEIRLLGNFESAEHKFDLRQFKQRISLRMYIDRLTPFEVQQYIKFRWAQAGAIETPPFTADATAGIVQWSKGIPRLINSICDTALLMAYADECPLVGLNYIRAAARNLALVDVAVPPAVPHPAAESPQADGDAPKPPISVRVPYDGPIFPSLGLEREAEANSSFLKRLAEKFGLSY